MVVVVLSLLLALGGSSCSNSPRTNHTLAVLKSRERHVFVISVDGLGAELLARELQKGHLPNLARLRSEGSYAEGVTGTYPSLTAPGHATIVTGKLPAQHGIYANCRCPVSGEKTRVWSSEDIRVPTMWDAARQAHLTSAAISWPLAGGAPINWNLTGLLSSANGDEVELRRLAKWATPGMIEEVVYGLGQVVLGGGDDAIRTRVAIYVIKKYRPNLLLLHLDDLDHAGHRYGPASPETADTLERIDAYIGDLLATIRESGLENTTDVFVVSDHGMMSYNIEIQPNVLLAQAGLITVNEHGKIIGGKIRTVANDGSFFLCWPESENLKASVDAALHPLREQGLVQAVLERDDLAKLGADPDAQMALEAPPGAIFESHARGALIHRLKATRGAHGYLPSRPGVQAVFIAAGPGITAGVNLHQIQMTAICPTVLKALGIDDSQFGVRLAIFVPGCCSDNRRIWSGMGTGGVNPRSTQAKN